MTIRASTLYLTPNLTPLVFVHSCPFLTTQDKLRALPPESDNPDQDSPPSPLLTAHTYSIKYDPRLI